MESQSNFQVKEERNIQIGQNKKLDFCDPMSHLRESTISDLESQLNFQVKGKKYLNRPINKEN